MILLIKSFQSNSNAHYIFASVLTGVFPELGGGGGLNMGKDKMKTLIENFGGRVTGSVSGKTNFVVVGKNPGASKVSQATAKSIPLVDLLALNRVM